MKESKPRRPIRTRVYYRERRKKVAEMRALGMSYDAISRQIEVHGFAPVSASQAYLDHKKYLAETQEYIVTFEHKAEIIERLETLFTLALKAYNEAQRQTKDGARVPDPYAQGILLQRAMEILERLAELCGFMSRRGIAVTQSVNMGQAYIALEDLIRKRRAERGLSTPRGESLVPGKESQQSG